MTSKNKAVRRKVRFGTIYADEVDFAGALKSIASTVEAGSGGFVVTPNIDHVCLAETDPTLADAYAKASLSLVDGQPLVWLARLMGCPLPEKISGSDLIVPLCQQAARRGDRVYLLGGAEGVGEKAAAALKRAAPGLIVAGMDSPPLGFDKDPAANEVVLARIRQAQPQLILVALGAPKQEKWMAAHAAAYSPAVALGIGASLDFLAGTAKRAPAWLSRVGLEWAYRLAREPSRMAGRYLVRDRAIVPIAVRMLRLPPSKRSYFA